MTEGKKTMVVSVRLTEDVHDGLAALAKAERRKLASYLALVLEDHLAEKQRPAKAEGKGTRQKG